MALYPTDQGRGVVPNERPAPDLIWTDTAELMKGLTRRRPLRAALVVAIVSLAVGLVGVLWTAWRARSAQVDAVRDEVRRLATAVAATVDPVAHQRLVHRLQTDSADYRAVLAPLLAIHESLPSVTYIYTMVQRDGQYYFVLDTATVLTEDEEGGALIPSVVMERYEAPDPELMAAFREKKAQASREPHSDRYGTWVTGYAPILDTDGRMVGALGLDLSVSQFVTRLEDIVAARTFGVGLVVALAFLIGFLVWRGEQRAYQAESRAIAERAAALEILAKRERLLTGSSTATRLLLAGDADADAATRGLAALGEAAHADRVLLCRILAPDGGDAQGPRVVRVLRTWTREASSCARCESVNQTCHADVPALCRALAGGGPLSVSTAVDDPTAPCHVSSLILPIPVDDVVWGFVQLDACTARWAWSPTEQRILAGTASILGGLERLRLAREEAEAGARAKSRFLAGVSHDLRTPMAGVLGMTEFLAASGLRDDQRRLAEAALRSGRALLRLLDDVVDLARLDAGRLELRPMPFRVDALVPDVLQVFAEEAARKGLALRHEIAPDVPERLLGDVVRLRQLLFNLVGNAVKFAERGFVRLAASAARRTDGAFDVTFLVEDTGPGIDPALLPTLFEPFVRGEGAARRKPGAGLGLSICSQLVERMGGQIAADTRLAEGSTFRVVLPLEAAAAASEPAGPTPAAAASPASRPLADVRVLVADDDPVLLELAAVVLERQGCRTTLVREGREAVAAFAPGAFDLALIDLRMPGMDGPAVARRIREMEAEGPGRTPILALTASTSDEDRAICLAAGIDDVLAKPYTNDQLVAAVSRLARTGDLTA